MKRYAVVSIFEGASQRMVFQHLFPLDGMPREMYGIEIPATANAMEAEDRPYSIHVMELHINE